MEWTSLVSQIEEALFPKLGLTVWESAVYYHLLRQTWVLDQEETQCSIARVALAVGISDWKAREAPSAITGIGSGLTCSAS